MTNPVKINMTLGRQPDGAYRWSEKPSWNPLLAVGYEGIATGAAAPFSLSGVMSTDRSVSGMRSMKINLAATNPGVICGSAGFGGTIMFPEIVPVGETVWYSCWVFFPEKCALSYTFDSTNTGGASGCSNANNDGNPTGTKFLALEPDVGTSRIYTHVETSYRGAPLGLGRIQIEAGAGVALFTEPMPKGRWFHIETVVLVHKSAGYVKTYWDGVLKASITNVRTIADEATGLKSIRIGDYFNGTPFNDGTYTTYFYVDNVLVATSKNGYGIPSGRDAQGNPIIGAAPRLIDFQ